MINLFFTILDYSGAKTYANELLGSLTNQSGIALHKIFFESKYYDEYVEVTEAGIVNIHIPKVTGKGVNPQKYAKRCVDLITPIVESKKNLIFHLNSSTQLAFGEETKRRFGAKLVYTLQHLPSYSSYLAIDDFKNNNLTITEGISRKRMIEEADKIICITEFAKNTVCSQYSAPIEKTEVIYNGYGSIECNPAKDTDWSSTEFGFRKNEQLILFAGRLDTEKGVYALINVFKRVFRDFPNTRLVFAGKGDFKEPMKQCLDIAGRVTFTGNIEKEQLRKLYSIAYLGVTPSQWELFGYVPIEMMFHSLPVVISNVPGMNELVEDGINGLICEVNKTLDGSLELKIDESSLYSKIIVLLKDYALANRIAQEGRVHWENNFTAEHMGRATMKLYKQLFATKN